jgi:cell division protein FtsW
MLTIKDSRVQLVLVTFTLVLTGLMFVYSAGAPQAMRLGQGEMYFLMKQLLSCGLGIFALGVAMYIPLNFYRKMIKPLFVLTLALLVAVYFQPKINGAHRWFLLPGISIQPSELAKFTIVVYLAHYLDKKYDRIADLSRGFLPATILVGGLAALVMFEPDLGTTFLIMMVAFTMFVVGGVRIKHVLGMLAFISPVLISSLLYGYHKGRLLIFLNPWADKYGDGYQLVQSMMAVGSGGIFGKGIGNSTQKLLFLPEAHTDFIYAIIAEETGFIGAFLVLALVVFFFRIVVKQALKHTDRYKKLLMLGISSLLFYQSAINIGVVLGLLPTKGITLPFVSYGGSALLVSLFLVGVLLRGMEEVE